MTTTTVNTRLFHFIAGRTGAWIVERSTCICGDPLPWAPRLAVTADGVPDSPEAGPWSLRGITSNERYVTRAEKIALAAKQEGLGRAKATHAALIPIRKNAAWWAMTQDERRHILEEQSQATTPLTSLPGLNSLRPTPAPSTNCWPRCAHHRNGNTSTAKSISA
jgi:hypothetical protein